MKFDRITVDGKYVYNRNLGSKPLKLDAFKKSNPKEISRKYYFGNTFKIDKPQIKSLIDKHNNLSPNTPKQKNKLK